MKFNILAVAIALSAHSWSVNACINLSGTYEFKGVDGRDCKSKNSIKMEVSPIPLGSAIKPYSDVIIKQKNCTSLDFIYEDERYTNSNGIKKVYPVDLKKALLGSKSLDFSEKKSGLESYYGSIAYTDKTSWSLKLDSNKNLRMIFNHRSLSLYNFIIPNYDSISFDCTLTRK